MRKRKGGLTPPFLTIDGGKENARYTEQNQESFD